MNVPDKLTYNEAVTQDYYNHDYITVSECFPAYLYPTQSNKYLNITRSREYCDIIDKDNAPRAIAYYHYGFMCALLDGHHKAYAAAMKGVRLHSLIIIPCQNVLTKNYGDTERYGVFADIIISMKELPNYKADNRANDSLSIINFPDNNIIPETDLILECYPNIDELTGFILSELEEVDLTEELVDKWLIRNSDEDQSKLKYSLGYFAKTDIKKGMMIAKRILKSDNSAYYLKETAMRFIVRHKSDESEQLAAGAYSVRIQGMNRQYHISLRDEFDEHDGDESRYIVLLDDEYLVATCRFYELSSDCVMIGRVVVLPEYRNQHLGRLLIQEAEKWIVELGYCEIRIDSRVVASGFYEKLGYSRMDDEIIKSWSFECVKMNKMLKR